MSINDKQKTQLRKTTLAIRHLLEGRNEEGTGKWIPGDIEIALRSYGIFRDRDWISIERLPHLSPDQRLLRARLEEAIRAMKERGEPLGQAVTKFLRESAYTWWNRLVALRAMEMRGIIDETIRIREAYAGRSLRHFRFRDQHPDRCQDENEGLLALLEVTFTEVAHDLPLVFDPKSPLTLVSPSPQCLRTLVRTLSEEKVLPDAEPLDDEVFAAPDLLGWVYQFWNEEEKNRVFEQASRYRKKIDGQDIIPATCIYTEPYMVQFLVQNSLGHLWAAIHPNSPLLDTWTSFIQQSVGQDKGEKRPVKEITFLDPACGSGHFLLAAFDLFYQMYEEEGEIQTPKEICESIFENNLFGIDIDYRSVQLAAVGLYLKAKEKAHDFLPQRMNLVAADVNLPADGQLERFLDHHPEDRPLIGPLKTIFKDLEGVSEIGSLLGLESPFEEMLREVRRRELAPVSLTARQRQILLFPSPPTPIQLELPVGIESLDEWKARTLDRLRRHFEMEAGVLDFSQALFGAQAEKGLGLIELLSRRYDVVATNPPYMGSKNMGKRLKDYVSRHYEDGKRDLFAAFVLRCLSLTRHGGYVAMVTQQSWMFLRSFAAMRKRILEEETVDAIVHLGEHGFSEPSAAGAFTVLFTLRHCQAPETHHLWAARLIGPKSAHEKAGLLERAIKGDAPKIVTTPKQKDLLGLPQTPMVYWLRPKFFELLRGKTLGDVADVCQGLVTADDSRFVRMTWEVAPTQWGLPLRQRRWVPFEKGGGYGKWYGHHWWAVDWEFEGARIKATPSPRVQNEQRFFKSGWTYSYMARGSYGLRLLEPVGLFAHISSAVIPRGDEDALASKLNARLSSYLVRALAGRIQLTESYIWRLPLPTTTEAHILRVLQNSCVALKRCLIACDPTERSFDLHIKREYSKDTYLEAGEKAISVATILHTLEGINEREVSLAYDIAGDDIDAILDESGTPAGWHHLIAGFERLPCLPDDISVPVAMIEKKLESQSVRKLSATELRNLKDRLCLFYEKGPGAKIEDEEVAGRANERSEEDETEIVGGYIPIPPETFLEELSQKLEIHPISVYWLLQDIKNGGARCLSEEKNHMRDWITVLVLKLLGHRWPREVEAGLAVESYADKDGIIPLVEGTGERTLLDRVRERLAAAMGEKEAHAFEQFFRDLMGSSLEGWLADSFFPEHTRQFRKRPLAWVIQSGRVGKNGTRSRRRKKGQDKLREGGFSCMVYYHALDRDLLAKVRTRYLRPIIQRREFECDEARKKASTGEVAARADVERLENILEELSGFESGLRAVETKGFWCSNLEEGVKEEQLDLFTARQEGAPPPSDRVAFLRQEQVYDPDINDGVRVNIAPLQREGLLAFDVLSKRDVEGAIADRARWRAEERRLCRGGKLRGPGWWEVQA